METFEFLLSCTQCDFETIDELELDCHPNAIHSNLELGDQQILHESLPVIHENHEFDYHPDMAQFARRGNGQQLLDYLLPDIHEN